MTMVTFDIASRFARLTLSHLEQQYPYKMDHVLAGPEDARPPITFHPIFHGSFDWHSCVHGWWQVMTLLRLHPQIPEAAEIREKAHRLLTREKVAGELAYLSRPTAAGFERPYGWGWLLALHGELTRHDAPWAANLEPLTRAFAERFKAYLPKLTYPIIVGTHFNTAFALIHARRWAMDHDSDLLLLIEDRARDWFRGGREWQVQEPAGDEFLSPALTQAMLMSHVLSREEFAGWFARFLPRTGEGRPDALFHPAFVSDRTDGKIAHLDGLNLSRAWCWHRIGARLAPSTEASVALTAAQAHIDASLPHIADHYMGTHWLASFALLALMDVE